MHCGCATCDSLCLVFVRRVQPEKERQAARAKEDDGLIGLERKVQFPLGFSLCYCCWLYCCHPMF
jgi:hypothetical protein